MDGPLVFRFYRPVTVRRAVLAGMKGASMRSILWIIIASLGATLVAAQKTDAPLQVSKEAVSADQIAIYRAVVIDYLKDSGEWVNLANKTAPLRLSGPSASGGCDPEFDLEANPSPTPLLHQVDPKVARGLNVTLVDPNAQEAKIKKNDPRNLKSGTDNGGGEVSGQQLDNSERRAFQNALFTLSETAFDKAHRRVVVSYSYVCGEHCGHGETLILEKAGGKWKISRMCGEWVS
jgi:hypothetical protein